MTQFEYVSIAIALVYSFAVSRIIAALPSVFARECRDWIESETRYSADLDFVAPDSYLGGTRTTPIASMVTLPT